jgi:hypothetical protein
LLLLLLLLEHGIHLQGQRLQRIVVSWRARDRAGCSGCGASARCGLLSRACGCPLLVLQQSGCLLLLLLVRSQRLLLLLLVLQCLLAQEEGGVGGSIDACEVTRRPRESEACRRAAAVE